MKRILLSLLPALGVAAIAGGWLLRASAAFTCGQQAALLAAFGSILLSVFLHVRGKRALALAALLAGTLGLRLFAVSLDPFLNLWDERFHALVAKNMIAHPFAPALYADPVLAPGPAAAWDRSHIWLHKQPLFLWQIALCFRLLGTNEFALRLPSAVLSTLMVLAIWRMGERLYGWRTGYIAALLAATSFYVGELVSGSQSVDHNDVAFLAYVSGSLWAWVEYETGVRRRTSWAVAVGIFAGMAVLTKWLMGLVVFLAWGVTALARREWPSRKHALDFVLSVITAAAVFLPWQVYTSLRFPEEAHRELAYNGRHFFEVLEGHAGSVWYHFLHLPTLYGLVAACALPLGLWALATGTRHKAKIGLLTAVGFVYAFFSLAATKMPSYPLLVGAVIYLALAVLVARGLDWIARWMRAPRAMAALECLLLVAIGGGSLQAAEVAARHTHGSRRTPHRAGHVHNRDLFKQLANALPTNAVLFNVRGQHFVEAMFYTGLPAYDFIPSAQQCRELRGRGRCVVVFDDGRVPDGLKTNTDVRVIAERVIGPG